VCRHEGLERSLLEGGADPIDVPRVNFHSKL
jgi:hypothetical protein